MANTSVYQAHARLPCSPLIETREHMTWDSDTWIAWWMKRNHSLAHPMIYHFSSASFEPKQTLLRIERQQSQKVFFVTFNRSPVSFLIGLGSKELRMNTSRTKQDLR
jgi:hypothetical protein